MATSRPLADAPLRDLAMGGAFLRRLETLRLRIGRSARAASAGAGAVRGGRFAFLEHRPYVPGDDPRDLDWHLYARTDELHLKVFGTESRRPLRLWLDASASMDALPGKADFACRLAAALAHLALASGGTVELFAVGSGRPLLPPCRGPAASRRVIACLERLPFAGAAEWETDLRGSGRSGGRAGARVAISDFWTDDPPGTVAARFARGGGEALLLHVLAREERDPCQDGAVRLEDAETGAVLRRVLTASDRARVRAETGRQVDALRSAAAERGVRYLLCPAEETLEATLFGALRRTALLR